MNNYIAKIAGDYYKKVYILANKYQLTTRVTMLWTKWTTEKNSRLDRSF